MTDKWKEKSHNLSEDEIYSNTYALSWFTHVLQYHFTGNMSGLTNVDILAHGSIRKYDKPSLFELSESFYTQSLGATLYLYLTNLKEIELFNGKISNNALQIQPGLCQLQSAYLWGAWFIQYFRIISFVYLADDERHGKYIFCNWQ